MKPSQLDKLYDKLSPTELGMMAFDAIARKDESEADTILKNVGWNTYRSINADYRQQVEGLILLSHVYSIEHWKTRALMLQACAMLGKAVSKDDVDLEAFGIQCFKRLVSIEIALVKACEVAKVDVGSVKSFACVQSFQYLPEHADPDLVLEFTESFKNLVILGK